MEFEDPKNLGFDDYVDNSQAEKKILNCENSNNYMKYIKDNKQLKMGKRVKS